MDSMIGYKNEKYLNFGRTAAKSDDVCNYLPSRISAYLMIAAAYLGGSDFSGKGAYRIYKRDRRNHASPNSAQTESVCAGALGIQLAGRCRIFWKSGKKPHIGDDTRPVEYEDIRPGKPSDVLNGMAWRNRVSVFYGTYYITLGRCRGADNSRRRYLQKPDTD